MFGVLGLKKREGRRSEEKKKEMKRKKERKRSATEPRRSASLGPSLRKGKPGQLPHSLSLATKISLISKRDKVL